MKIWEMCPNSPGQKLLKPFRRLLMILPLMIIHWKIQLHSLFQKKENRSKNRLRLRLGMAILSICLMTSNGIYLLLIYGNQRSMIRSHLG